MGTGKGKITINRFPIQRQTKKRRNYPERPKKTFANDESALGGPEKSRGS